MNRYQRVVTEIYLASKQSSAQRLWMSLADTYLLAKWCSAQRRRELKSGLEMELQEPGQ